MWGIAGFITARSHSLAGEMEQFLAAMSNSITHRGPDDSGLWSDLEAGVWLGHRRLAIVDLSTAGHQPMKSASGRYMIVFNGEIYNYVDIAKELSSAIDDIGMTLKPIYPNAEDGLRSIAAVHAAQASSLELGKWMPAVPLSLKD